MDSKRGRDYSQGDINAIIQQRMVMNSILYIYLNYTSSGPTVIKESLHTHSLEEAVQKAIGIADGKTGIAKERVLYFKASTLVTGRFEGRKKTSKRWVDILSLFCIGEPAKEGENVYVKTISGNKFSLLHQNKMRVYGLDGTQKLIPS